MKNGITIMATAIVIMVMIILASTAIIASDSVIESVNKTKFVTEVENIQEALQEYKLKNGKYPETQIKEINLANISEQAKTQFNSELYEVNSENQMIFKGYLVDFNLINIKDTNFGNNKDNTDIYVYSAETGRVYYAEGIKYKEMTYYTAAEEISGNDYNIKYRGKPINIGDILIYPSSTELTSEAVTLMVRVPKSKINFTIEPYKFSLSEQNRNDILQPKEIGYDVYLINSSEIVENYALMFTYEVMLNNGTENSDIGIDTTDTIELHNSYTVSNVDETDPVITVNNNPITITENGVIKKYLGGISASDPESEIDVIKYEYGQYNLEYFKYYGKILNSNKIDITDKAYCTIYAKTKIGRERVQQIVIATEE